MDGRAGERRIGEIDGRAGERRSIWWGALGCGDAIRSGAACGGARRVGPVVVGRSRRDHAAITRSITRAVYAAITSLRSSISSETWMATGSRPVSSAMAAR